MNQILSKSSEKRLSPRICFLRDQLRNTKPSICLERARLLTEFYQLCDIDTIISRKARFFRYYMDHKKIFIGENDLIVGNYASRFRACSVFPEFAAQWILDDMDTFETRGHDPLVFDRPEDKREMAELVGKWVSHSLEDIVNAKLSDVAKEAAATGVITIGSRNFSTASHVPDYDTALKKGLRGIIDEIKEQLRRIKQIDNEWQEKKDTWEGMIASCEAAIAYAHRYAKLAREMTASCGSEMRKAELLGIAEVCEHIPEYPARNFREAIQFVWFIHLAYLMENIGHNHGFGRFDQYMYPFFEADIAGGRLSEQQAVELIQELFIKITETFELRNSIESEAYAGYPMWNNLTIGGIDEAGKDACNHLTYLVLEASEGVQTTQPSLSFRYNKKDNREVLRKALSLTLQGMGQPAFFNDDINIPRILANGGTIKEARNYSLMGCVECVVPGKTDCRPTAGFINGLKVLELTLHNGYDPIYGKQIGPKTGAPEQLTNMEELLAAYKNQMAYFISLQVDAYNIVTGVHSQIVPTIFISALIDGCIQSGRVLQKGGAKYNFTSNFLTGLANTVDSFAVIEDLVFRKKLISLPELVTVLDNNYSGQEHLRQLFINKVPKYGNDNDFVDDYAALLIDFLCTEDEKYLDTRSTPYQMMVQSQIYNVWQGRYVGATPDGRLSGDPMADNASPTAGVDRNGPTASSRSVAKMDELLVHKGVLLNQKFDPGVVRGQKGLQMLDTAVSGYFAEGGQHIQINVVDEATLRDAQAHPEQYKNLMVRVAGYSAYFVELDQLVQENIIARTVHGNE